MYIALSPLRQAFEKTLTDQEARKLSSGAKMLLLALASHCNPEGVCYPSVQRLAGLLSVSRRTVHRHLRELRDAGQVRILRTEQRLASTYQLTGIRDVPATHSSSPANSGPQLCQDETPNMPDSVASHDNIGSQKRINEIKQEYRHEDSLLRQMCLALAAKDRHWLEDALLFQKDGALVLQVPSAFHKEWIGKRLLSCIEETAGQPIVVEENGDLLFAAPAST